MGTTINTIEYIPPKEEEIIDLPYIDYVSYDNLQNYLFYLRKL